MILFRALQSPLLVGFEWLAVDAMEMFLGVHLLATVVLGRAAAPRREYELYAQFVLPTEKWAAQVQNNTALQVAVFGDLLQVLVAILVAQYACMYTFRARCRFLDFLRLILGILYKAH